MLFNSFSFVLLVLVTLAVYYVPFMCRWQPYILIVASLVFYGVEQPILVILLLSSALLNAIVGNWLLQSDNPKTRLAVATAGVIANLLLLAFFKYNRLLADLVWVDLDQSQGPGYWFLMLPLPLGISFFTFKGISLVVDAYRSMKQSPADGLLVNQGTRQNLVSSTLHILFFPQLLAGPITRYPAFQRQFATKYLGKVPWESAIKMIIAGYFLKMVVADNLKDLTFWMQYPQFTDKSSLDLLAFSFGYSMQIFADFAGYSLIAIGVSALFGYQVPPNFNFPYIAQSFSEFWRRWHISLSSWLRDYLYIPLGGNRKSEIRTYANLMIVMFLGGLWHGAAWSFATWGIVHGLALAVERPFRKTVFFTSESLYFVIARTLLVFSVVTFAWTFFVLTDFNHAVQYFGAILSNFHYGAALSDIFLIGLYSIPVIVYHGLYLYQHKMCRRLSPSLASFIYGAMLTAIVINSGSQDAFIYFQF